MDSTMTALVFFFGVFWAAALGAVAPFQAFDTRMLFRKGERSRGARRLCAGLVIVNILPVVGLCALLKSSLMDARQVWGVAVAAIASLAVFSVPRLLHAIVATRPFFKYFYSTEEVQGLKIREKTVDGFAEHLLSAIAYAVVPLGAAWLLLTMAANTSLASSHVHVWGRRSASCRGGELERQRSRGSSPQSK